MVLSKTKSIGVAVVLIITIAATVWFAARDEALAITVYKIPGCTCCQDWIEHLVSAGFKVAAVEEEALTTIRAQHGISDKLSSCHTAIIDGYVIEGHVPADHIKQLLNVHPDAQGLVVPGMPQGSPGMEAENGLTQPYDVLLLMRDGSTRIFAHHG